MATQSAAAAAKPATTTTVERFPATTAESDIDALVQLRIDAGAIKCTKSKDAATGEWIITTQWNVIGGNG
jgi:hypothetical protein